MKPAYIICAHKRPDLLIRLVRLLHGSPVAIHIDRKSDIFDTARAELGALPNVTFLPRHVCHWGLFGHVKASLEGLEWFILTSCDYAILITGQCYPIKPPSEIEKDLTDLNGRSVIQVEAFPKADWMEYDGGGYKRLDRFFFKLGKRVWPRSLKLWTRKPPLGLHPHGGASYWCLSRACVDYAVTFVHAHPKVSRFFSTTFVPDEMFFQTILANSSHRSELTDALIHYTHWQHGSANPDVLTADMVPAAMASGAWFARKFEDPAVLDMVDSLRDGAAVSFPESPWQKKISESTPQHVAGNLGLSKAETRLQARISGYLPGKSVCIWRM